MSPRRANKRLSCFVVQAELSLYLQKTSLFPALLLYHTQNVSEALSESGQMTFLSSASEVAEFMLEHCVLSYLIMLSVDQDSLRGVRGNNNNMEVSSSFCLSGSLFKFNCSVVLLGLKSSCYLRSALNHTCNGQIYPCYICEVSPLWGRGTAQEASDSLKQHCLHNSST